jgi:hypothetical protein
MARDGSIDVVADIDSMDVMMMWLWVVVELRLPPNRPFSFLGV